MKMNEEKSDRMEGESDPEYYFRKSLEQELPEAGNIKFKLYHKEEDDVGFLYSIEEGIKIVKYESSHYVKVNLIPWSEIANKLEDFIDQEEISLYLTKKGISVDNENYFTLSADTFKVVYPGHYIFLYTQSFEAGSNNNAEIKVNSDDGLLALSIGGTGIAGEDCAISCNGYFIASANEGIWFEIRNTSDNGDFDLLSGNFVIWYLHP